MTSPEPIPFTPVRLRSRRDGWTPERQRDYVALLGQGHRSAAALRILGKTKQTLHALCRRPDAGSFRAACDAAREQARRERADRQPPSAYERAMAGYLRPFYRRGRLIRVEHRFASMGLLRILNRIDKLVGTSDLADDMPEEVAALLDQLRDGEPRPCRPIEHQFGQFPARIPWQKGSRAAELPRLAGPYRSMRTATSEEAWRTPPPRRDDG